LGVIMSGETEDAKMWNEACRSNMPVSERDHIWNRAIQEAADEAEKWESAAAAARAIRKLVRPSAAGIRLSPTALQQLVNHAEAERAVGSRQRAADLEMLLKWYGETTGTQLPPPDFTGPDEDDDV
jgi:hypothetical protein